MRRELKRTCIGARAQRGGSAAQRRGVLAHRGEALADRVRALAGSCWVTQFRKGGSRRGLTPSPPGGRFAGRLGACRG